VDELIFVCPPITSLLLLDLVYLRLIDSVKFILNIHSSRSHLFTCLTMSAIILLDNRQIVGVGQSVKVNVVPTGLTAIFTKILPASDVFTVDDEVQIAVGLTLDVTASAFLL